MEFRNWTDGLQEGKDVDREKFMAYLEKFK
jgi:hypothetical protein